MSSTGRKRPTKPEAEEVIDEVEEAGDESFPSSDPPSWTPTHAGRPAPPSGDRPGPDQKRARRPTSGRTAG
jgi:hypothetical protein